ncbi:hypothetical protein HDU93_003633, partial [Gonapodya sp. JEL0774]
MSDDGADQLPPLPNPDLQATDDGWGDVIVKVAPPNGWMIAHIVLSLIACEFSPSSAASQARGCFIFSHRTVRNFQLFSPTATTQVTVVLPLGVALARRSRAGHIILQIIGVVLVYFISVTAKKGDRSWRTWAEALGWEFTDLSQDVHNKIGWLVFALVTVQGPILGVLRTQLNAYERSSLRNIFADPNRYSSLKSVVFRLHNAIGYLILPMGYSAIAAGFVSLTGTCGLDGLSGCASHLVFGSILIWYSAFAILAILRTPTLPNASGRRRRAPEFYDSLSITAFGLIAVLANVTWGSPSAATALLLVSGGIMGCMLQMSDVLRWRNPVPGMIIVAVGVAVLSKAGYDPFA